MATWKCYPSGPSLNTPYTTVGGEKVGKDKRVAVPEEVRTRLFLWCARHCCFCGKSCTTNIEIHHIDRDSSNNDLDNLIPVCFDCHGELVHYSPEHPKGSKYRDREIKTRREQIYELHTRQYLRPVDIKISRFMHHATDPNGKLIEREWGDTSCTVRTLSQDIPLQVRLKVVPYQNRESLDVEFGEHYSGEALWNLNPSQVVFGHFSLPITEESDPFDFRVEIFWSIVDVLEREHSMLPFSYVWNDPKGDWWFDPRVIGDG